MSKVKNIVKNVVQKIKSSIKNVVQGFVQKIKAVVQKIAVSVDSHIERNIIRYFIAGLMVMLVVVGSLMYSLGASSNVSLIHEAFLNGQKDAYVYMWDTLYDADVDLFDKVLAVADAAALKV